MRYSNNYFDFCLFHGIIGFIPCRRKPKLCGNNGIYLLAVIAIVITLVDITGQKQNIMQLRDTIDRMDDSTNDVKLLINETKQQLEAVMGLKNELIAKISKQMNGVIKYKRILTKALIRYQNL